MNLYSFQDLREYVEKRLGVDIENINSNFQPIKEKLNHIQLNKNVEFKPDGIFYIDKKGVKHKGFLYIEKGYTQRTVMDNNLATRVPTFHVANCQTIEEQKRRINFNGHYVFSTEVVWMEDYDKVMKQPRVCKHCVRLSSEVHNGMLTDEYREKVILNNAKEGNFFKTELPKDVTLNFWGYTASWDEERRNYRMKMKFTCEECGINLNKTFADGYYLDTHHIDGNKKNNDEDNLQCLCVLCHANNDEYHKANFSKGANKQKLVDFIRGFEDELRKVGNKYLSKYKP